MVLAELLFGVARVLFGIFLVLLITYICLEYFPESGHIERSRRGSGFDLYDDDHKELFGVDRYSSHDACFFQIDGKIKNNHTKLDSSEKNKTKSGLAETQNMKDVATETHDVKVDEKLCVVCLDENKSHLCVPCGHLCLCLRCGGSLKVCPLCRTRIDRVVKVYFS
jgi:hypothetical protein